MKQNMLKISVIIPAYNEEKTIISLLESVNAQNSDDVKLEVVVIDDGSIDRTADLLNERPDLYATLIRLPQNRGKGGAVKAGLKKATGDYILFQDADLEYSPTDYANLFLPIVEFDADIVMGSRLTAPPYTRVHYYWHRVGNRFITFFFNILNNTTFTDVYSCYLVYRRSLVDRDKLRSEGWEQQAEILSKAVRSGGAIYEVPIRYRGRTYGEGKKIRAYHVPRILYMMLRERFFPSA